MQARARVSVEDYLTVIWKGVKGAELDTATEVYTSNISVANSKIVDNFSILINKCDKIQKSLKTITFSPKKEN